MYLFDELFCFLAMCTFLMSSFVFFAMWMTSCWENILARCVWSRQGPQSAWPKAIITNRLSFPGLEYTIQPYKMDLAFQACTAMQNGPTCPGLQYSYKNGPSSPGPTIRPEKMGLTVQAYFYEEFWSCRRLKNEQTLGWWYFCFLSVYRNFQISQTILFCSEVDFL